MPPKRAGSQSRQRIPAVSTSSPLNLVSALGDHASDVDPSLLAIASAGATSSTTATPIDPTLFTIEQVVNDVRRGHVKPEDLDDPQGSVEQSAPPVEERHGEAEAATQHTMDSVLHAHDDLHVAVPIDSEHGHIQLDDDGIDPALREIVNSLTNAQQSHSGFSDNPDERERLDRERLQQTLQTTLEDFAQNGFGSYGGMFNTNFPEASSSRFLIPPIPDTQGEGSTTKRGRGRPKGSKNKPKPNAPPPPPAPPKRPRGRPPKVRSNEEVEELERRKQERELGISRKRGRPRKYPEIGLVRELRLKKNRGYFAEKMAQLQERQSAERDSSAFKSDTEERGDAEGSTESDAAAAAAAAALAASEVSLGQQVAAAVAHDADQDDAEHYSWPYQDGQSLLDVVGMGSSMDVDRRDNMDVGVGVELPDAPSVGAMGQSDEGMRGVFNLADVSGQQ